jgi:hypothetical protein
MPKKQKSKARSAAGKKPPRADTLPGKVKYRRPQGDVQGPRALEIAANPGSKRRA